MVTLSTFLQFWGVVFLATTMFVCFFKPEVENGVNDKVLGPLDTYKQVKRAVEIFSCGGFSTFMAFCLFVRLRVLVVGLLFKSL